MSAVLNGNILTVTFENDNWKTEQENIITSVVDSSSGFYSADVWTYDGKNVLRSGAIGNNGTSQTVITFILSENGSVEFNYRVSSENNYDWFYILIDGTQVIKKSGTSVSEFTVYSQELSAGEHSITLKYTKDSSSSSGSGSDSIIPLFINGMQYLGNGNNTLGILTLYIPFSFS